jgi:iron complex transport system substrate-binding protein
MRYLILLLLLSACGHPTQQLAEEAPFLNKSFTDDRGQQVNFPKPPERIVSLAPNITEMLFAIGAGSKMVGRSHACNFPGDAMDLPAVRTFPEFSAEAVLALRPDFILGTLEIQKADDMIPFQDQKIPVMMQTYGTTEDIYRNLKQLGEILKLESNANALIDSLRKKEGLIAAATKNEIHYNTLILLSVDPLITVGGKGFLNDLLQKAGGKNAFEHLSENYAQITVEAIIATQPEFIILPTTDERLYAKLIEKFPDLHTRIPAALNNQVFILDPNLLLRPGPRTIEGLGMLTQVLHPRINPDFLGEETDGAVPDEK